jgi:hypothetical protein
MSHAVISSFGVWKESTDRTSSETNTAAFDERDKIPKAGGSQAIALPHALECRFD